MTDRRIHLASKAVSAINRSRYGDAVERDRAPWYKKVRNAAGEVARDDVLAMKGAAGKSQDKEDVRKAAHEAMAERKGVWKSFITDTYKAVGSDFASRFYKKTKKGSIMYYAKAEDYYGNIDAEWFAEEGAAEEEIEEWMLWGDEYVDGTSEDKASFIIESRDARVDRGIDGMEEDDSLSDLWQWLLIAAATGADFFAVTEVSTASNFGRRLAAERMAFDGGGEFSHEWVTVGDERVRPAHRDMDGAVLPLSEAFRVPGRYGSDQMMFPGDMSMGAGPDNTVNCRCTERVFIE